MRILFLPLITGGPAAGTISRCLAIAEHLRMFHHDVLFVTNGLAQQYVEEAGFPYLSAEVPDPPRVLHPLYSLSDVAVYLNLTHERFVRGALDAELRAVDAFKPDVLFSEFQLTAPITAAVTGLPLVSTACSPAHPRFASPLFADERAVNHDEAIAGFNSILNERELEPIEDVAELFFLRSQVKIAPTLLELEPLLSDVVRVHFVGHLLYDRRELAPLPSGIVERAHGKNLVFVYLGEGEIGPVQYVEVLPKALDGSEFHAIVAVGNHPDLPELPADTSNTTWVRYVPGRSILRSSRAVIFHGGQNTAMASLIHRVPSLIFPAHDFERDFNARALARIGTGLHCSTEEFVPEVLLDNLRQVTQPEFDLAAETFSWKVLRSGGPSYAAELVLSAAKGAAS